MFYGILFRTPSTCKNSAKASNKVARMKRPMNSFMIWATEHRNILRKRNPGMVNSEISKQLGAKWKSMSPEEKDPYYVMALQLTETLVLENPDCKYQPRRKQKATRSKKIEKDYQANTNYSALRIIARRTSFSGPFSHPTEGTSISGSSPQYTKDPASIQTTQPFTTSGPPAMISSQLTDSEYYPSSSAVQFPTYEPSSGQKNWPTYSTYFGGPADFSAVPSTHVNPQLPTQPLSNAEQYGEFNNTDLSSRMMKLRMV